jgi:hypothetical protein
MSTLNFKKGLLQVQGCLGGELGARGGILVRPLSSTPDVARPPLVHEAPGPEVKAWSPKIYFRRQIRGNTLLQVGPIRPRTKRNTFPPLLKPLSFPGQCSVTVAGV